MATLLIKNVLDYDAVDGKDRFARQIRDQITKVTEAAGDKEANIEVICGQIFVATGVPKAMDAVKELFKEVDGSEMKDLGDVAATSLKSRLSHEAKRAQASKDAAKDEK